MPASAINQLEASMEAVRAHEHDIARLTVLLSAAAKEALRATGSEVADSGWQLEKEWPLLDESRTLEALQGTFLPQPGKTAYVGLWLPEGADGESVDITKGAPRPLYAGEVSWWAVGDAYERVDGQPRSREEEIQGPTRASKFRFIQDLATWVDVMSSQGNELLATVELAPQHANQPSVRLFKDSELARAYFAWRTGQESPAFDGVGTGRQTDVWAGSRTIVGANRSDGWRKDIDIRPELASIAR